MIAPLLVFALLIFATVTDSLDSEWSRYAFRSAACSLAAILIIVGGVKNRLQLGWCTFALTLTVLWGLGQLILDSTVGRTATAFATLNWVVYLALFLAASQVPYSRMNLRIIVWAGGAYSVFAMVRLYLWHGPGEPIMGTFLNQNHFAALMELLFPVALWRTFQDRRGVMLALCALAMFLSVATSGSRAGVVLLLVELAYLGLRASRRPVLVLAATCVAAVILTGVMWSRFEKLATSEPYQSRTATATASLQMLRARPVLGFGLGTWANVYPAYAVHDTGFRLIHADNDWLEWAAEGGIPFAGIMLFLALLAGYSAFRQPWTAGCVAVLLHSLVEFPMQKQALWAWFIVLLALAQARRNSEIALRKHPS